MEMTGKMTPDGAYHYLTVDLELRPERAVTMLTNAKGRKFYDWADIRVHYYSSTGLYVITSMNGADE